jgi:putative protease
MTRSTFDLPLISPELAPTWEGFAAARPLGGALASPEPDAPQGEYAGEALTATVPLLATPNRGRTAELLAPAGGPDCAFAAFHFGADAIYLGLKKFSARAEAENFTLDELSEVVAYAHSLTPRRRVFVAVNTLLRNDELPELVETLAALEDMRVDALIIQDLAVYHLARRHFPRLELHGSTQMAVHNRAGAEALRKMGFARVVLARELTFEEVHDITAAAGVETEVFVHGALCYSYSGLCLFSSQTLGRSGNRGKCAYSCRDSFTVSGAPTTLRDGSPTRRDPTTGFPFSMKDLALPDHVPALRSAGVSCFKIEGRKKSPLYVATATDFYRKLIDGRLSDAERAAGESDLQSAFGRPWTRLFVDSHKDKEVADRDLVGHRGALIGRIESVHRDRKSRRIRFRSTRGVERHDGLQVDLPVLGKPFGFGVRRMWLVEGRTPVAVVEAPPGSLVEVELPQDHRDTPELPAGSLVYCASSNAVKRRYQHDRPKPGMYRVRHEVEIDLTVTRESAVAVGRAGVEVRRVLAGPFEPARDPAGTEAAARTAFEKLGDTGLTLARLTVRNPEGLFVPVSRLNALRRDLVAGLEAELARARQEQIAAVMREACPTPAPLAPVLRGEGPGVRGGAPAAESPLTPNPSPPKRGRGEQETQRSPETGARGKTKAFRWSVKVDRLAFLDRFTADDWQGVEEVIVDVTRDHPTLLADGLKRLADTVGPDRVRLALPALTRKWEEHALTHKIAKLRDAGWRRWEAANLSAWTYLGLDPSAGHTGEIDLATDWSVYALNRLAARQLLEMGVTRFALSPEDGLANIRPTLAEFGDRAVLIVYQDTPMFLAESCAYANLIGGCPGKANCGFEQMDMVSAHGETVTALDYHCRTIVLNQGPFCLSPRLPELAKAGAISLRADFIYRKYDADEVVKRWRLVRAGKVVPGGHAANFDRGVL